MCLRCDFMQNLFTPCDRSGSWLSCNNNIAKLTYLLTCKHCAIEITFPSVICSSVTCVRCDFMQNLFTLSDRSGSWLSCNNKIAKLTLYKSFTYLLTCKHFAIEITFPSVICSSVMCLSCDFMQNLFTPCDRSGSWLSCNNNIAKIFATVFLPRVVI